jgi:hypothetical protein
VKKVLIPLAGMPNQRDMDSLQSLIEGKDQRFRNVYIIPIDNPLTGKRKVYVEKRPGFEASSIGDCLGEIATGCPGSAVLFSTVQRKYVAVLCGTEVYVDCTSVGSTEPPETPEQGDGRIFAIEESVSPSSHAYVTTNNAVAWSAQDVSDNTGSYKDIDFGGSDDPDECVFCAVGVASSVTPKIMTSPSALTGDWTNQTAPAVLGINSVRWSPDMGLFLAGTNSLGLTPARIITSPDGVTWSILTGSFSFNNVRRVHANSTRILANLQASPGLVYSDNGGSSFSTTTITDDNGGGSVTNAAFRDCVWVPWLSLFVGGGNQLGGSGNYWGDGQNVTFNGTSGNASYPGTGVAIFRVAYSDDYVVGVDGFSQFIYYTTDGENWTVVDTQPAVSVTWSWVTWNGTVWCIGTYQDSGGFRNATASTPAGPWTIRSSNGYGTNITGLAARLVQ